MADADANEIETLMASQDQPLSSDIDPEDIESGCVFLYEEKGKIKCLLPDEIMEILENHLSESLSV